MSSKKALLLLAVGGLALAGYAAAASSGALPDGVDAGLGANAKCDRGVVDAAGAEARVALCERRGREAGLPPFREANGTVEGKWLGFGLDAATGQLRDVTSKGPMADQVVFRSITLGGALQDKVAGGRWVARDGGLKLLALDAPNDFLVIANTGNDTATITYVVADGIVLSALPDNVSGPNATGVVLTAGEHQAALRMLRGATDRVDGQTVTVTLPKDGAAVFHVRGFPRLLEHEMKGLHHADARHHEERGERGAGDRGHGGRGPPGPPPDAAPDQAQADLAAEA